MEAVWSHAYKEIKVDMTERPVCITDTVLNPRSNRERICEVWFEKYQIPAINISYSGILCHYSAGRTSGTTLDMGGGQTSVMAVVEGVTFPHLVRRGKVTGSDLTDYLQRLLAERGKIFSSSAEREVLHEMKEQHSKLTLDKNFLSDQSRDGQIKGRQKIYRLPDGKPLRVEDEFYQVPEALFDPTPLGHHSNDGIHHLLWNSIQMNDIDNRRDLTANIILVSYLSTL